MAGSPELLSIMVTNLVSAGKKHMAKGIYDRHKLTEKDFVNKETGRNKSGLAKDLENMVYEENKDFKPLKDLFEPISTPTADHLRLPADLLVEFIGQEAHVKKMEVLVGQKMIGVDSEWRPVVSKSNKTKGIALLQIAGFNEVFLVDLIALRTSRKLDDMLTRIFTN